MNGMTINEYIENLNAGKNTAERAYKLRKSLWERATAAYDKARMVENALKEDCDRIAKSDQAATAIDNMLLQIAKTGDTVTGNTDKARQAAELLVYEIRDIVCQAEAMSEKLKEFKIKIESVIGKDKPALQCVDEVMKTLPDVSTHGFAGLDKALSVIKNVNHIEAAIGGECGVNARLLVMTHKIKDCGFKEDIGAEEDALAKKYPCTIPAAADLTDSLCGSLYNQYAAKPTPSCGQDFEASFAAYRNKTKTNYNDAVDKSTSALAWLNCTTETKNAAEATFNACKAAYEAALAAKKC